MRIISCQSGAQNLRDTALDGKGIVVPLEDLRPATPKAAAKQDDSCGAHLSPGEKPNCWRTIPSSSMDCRLRRE
jgi:hypothetical protein